MLKETKSTVSRKTATHLIMCPQDESSPPGSSGKSDSNRSSGGSGGGGEGLMQEMNAILARR